MDVSTINSTVAAAAYNSGEQRAHTPAQTQSAPVQTPNGDARPAVSDADLEKIMEEPVKQANNALRGFDRQIEREFHEVTKVLMYKIRDTKTNEVIAEYPPRKIQDMIAKMWELAGLFIDQKA